MKKLVILLLTVFTISTVAICGCTDNNFEDKTKNVQVQEDEQDGKQEKPDFPDREKRDNERPHPHTPHLHPDRKLPQPKPTIPQK